MSTAGGVAVARSEAYFCYQCDRVVNLTPSPNSDLLCPNCNGGFLEEYDQPSPTNPNPNFSPSLFPSSVFPQVHPFSDPFFSSPFSPAPGFSSFGTTASVSGGGSGTGRGPVLFSSAGTEFNPFEFLQNHLQNLRASGANIQFVIENHPSDHGTAFQLPSNLGDYFLGPGLEQLIQQLAENDPNRYGTPPAAKKVVEGLPSVAVTDALINSDSAQCAVCMNDFELGSEAKEMPCKHIYHSDCILPWLELHNSCPVCRYELPTDDPDYENRRGNPRSAGLSFSGLGVAGGSGVGGGGGVDTNVVSSGDASSDGASQRSPNTERRFSISLPWSFNRFAASSAGGDSDGGQASGSDQQSSEHGQGPSQEGLD